MKAWVNLYIDMKDLEIDYTVHRSSDSTEMWGRVETREVFEVDIHSVSYNGVYCDDYDLSVVEDYVLNVLEDRDGTDV